MYELFPYFKLLRGRPIRFLFLGIGLACLASGAAVSLVSLSGWFITQSALVGVLGITTFSYLFPSAGIRAFALLRTFVRYSERVVNHQMTFQWLARLRIVFFAKAVSMPRQRFAVFRSGDLLSRAMADIDALDQVLLRVLIPTVSTGAIVLAGLAFLLRWSVLLTMLVLPSMLLAGVGLPLLMAWYNRRPGFQYVKSRARLRMQCIEALQGKREIVAYHAEEIVKGQIIQEMCQLEQVQQQMRRAGAMSAALTTGLAAFTALLVASVGIPLVITGALHGPTLVMICLLILGLFESIEALPLAYQFLGVVRKATQRLNGMFLEEQAEQNESARCATFPIDGVLTMKNVSFRYDGQVRHVLHNLHCTLPPATVVAVTGRSGVGKSTLLRLLAREMEPESGSIEIAGIPLTALSEEIFRSHVAFVSQDSHIFNATLRENLLMAKPEATTQEMQDVIAMVLLTEWLSELTDGLETSMGEQGYMLSGGERRRLSIAQALLKAPSLLLLDEPTIGIDRKTAVCMLQSIRTFLSKSTIVVATHDPMLISLIENSCNLELDFSRTR